MKPKYKVGDILRIGNEQISTNLKITEIKVFPPRILYCFEALGDSFPFPTAAYFEG